MDSIWHIPTFGVDADSRSLLGTGSDGGSKGVDVVTSSADGLACAAGVDDDVVIAVADDDDDLYLMSSS